MFQAKFNYIALKPATHKLTEYWGGALSVSGTCRLKCKYKKSSMLLEFYVIDTNASPVLAMKKVMAVSEEHEASSQSIRKEYADVF